MLPNLLLGLLHLRHPKGGDHVHAIGILYLVHHIIAPRDEGDKQHRHHEAGSIGKFADKGDLWDKATVPGLIHGLAEEHQQRGHEQEHRQQTANDRLDERQPQIRAKAEFHHGHGREAGDGGQAAGGNFRNGGGKGAHHRVMDVQMLMLLLIPVAEDNGVIHRQGKLQHDADGV